MACPTGQICVNPPDPRINYNLLPGEVLKTCPYNLSHAVLPMKFTKHVLNCHRLHCKDQAAKDEAPLFSICQYDRSHHVRNEELAFHEAQCKIDKEKEDDWSDDDQPAPAKVDFKVAPVEPPKVDEASMKTIQSECWESEGTSVRFDHRKRIEQLRLEGYNVINTLDHIGLTKSEKKEFYKKESKDMRICAQISFLSRMKKENSGTTGGGSTSGSSNAQPAPPVSVPSCASAYGFDDSSTLTSIVEDEADEGIEDGEDN